jgi:hypothetical protein
VHHCVSTSVQELAPQDAKGGYQRPSYSFGGKIGDPEHPMMQNRCAQPPNRLYAVVIFDVQSEPHSTTFMHRGQQLILISVVQVSLVCGQCLPLVPQSDVSDGNSQPVLVHVLHMATGRC